MFYFGKMNHILLFKFLFQNFGGVSALLRLLNVLLVFLNMKVLVLLTVAFLLMGVYIYIFHFYADQDEEGIIYSF